MSYEPRAYRRRTEPAGLVSFEVVVGETDLLVAAVSELGDEAESLVRDARTPLEAYVAEHPHFAASYVPIPVEPDAPDIVQVMAAAAERAGVGPMAAVAGAVAERVARGLAGQSPEVIVENGGDIYIVGTCERHVAIWGGEDGAHGLGLRIDGSALPAAVCSSSGRLGHSRSFGDADVAVVLSADGALADAVATALANRVRDLEDLRPAVEMASGTPGVTGALATVDGSVAIAGSLEILPITWTSR
jgi:ApbE superfamily uncharacterized protein (UPF0280 family)